MTPDALTLLAERLLTEARNALARIELGASQLTREACTPAGSVLSRGISDAVEDLDRLLARTLAPLFGARSAPPVARDVRELLPDLVQRLARSLEARGLALETDPGSHGVPGEPNLVRRAALVLLRAHANVAGTGGRLVLGLRSAPSRCGVSVAVRDSTNVPPSDGRWLEDARALALHHGGFLERLDSSAGTESTLWLPFEAPPCAAS